LIENEGGEMGGRGVGENKSFVKRFTFQIAQTRALGMKKGNILA
jgi:hypothetical protein